MATKTGMRYDDELTDETGFWGETEAQESESESFDDVADEPEDEMAEAALQVSEDWFQKAAREAEEIGPEILAEYQRRQLDEIAVKVSVEPEETATESDFVGVADLELAEIGQQVLDEIALAQTTTEPIADEEMAEQSDLDAILAQVDEAMIEADRPIELTADQLANGEVVAKKTAVLELFIKCKGFSRAVDSRQIVTEEYQAAANAKMLRSSKKMLVCNELEAIRVRVRKFKGDLEFLTLPSGLLRGGMKLTPLANVDKVEDLYREFKLDFKGLVRNFLAVYVQMKEQDRRVQGPLFNDQHYPALQSVAKSFSVDHRWLAFDAPAAMEGIQSADWREAGAKLRAQMAEASAEMQDVLRGQTAEYVQWLIDQLAVGEDGKRKSIAEGKFADMQKFLESASALNVAGDEELEATIEMAKAAIAGRDVADFKAKGKQRASADELRQQTAAAFEKIKAATDGWVVNAPVRPVYSLDEV